MIDCPVLHSKSTSDKYLKADDEYITLGVIMTDTMKKLLDIIM